MSNRFDKSRLPSRHVTVGPERAPHRSYLLCDGPDRGARSPSPSSASPPPGTRRRPATSRSARQAQAVKKGVAAAGGTPREFTTITVTDGIAMGHAGHEVVAGQPRGHRRLGRAHHARPLLRRAGRPRRLRQVAARADDGDGAAQRAVGLHVWRLDPARPLQRQGRDDAATCSRRSARTPPAR